MSILVKEVTNKKLLNDFIDFPYSLYKGNQYYVPKLKFDERATLDQKKNPAFEHCEARYWLAYKDGRVAGRIAGILNKKFIEKWNKKYLRFGWLDFADDEETARQLFSRVEAWAREQGMDAVHGPLGFTDLDYEGMLIDGFDQQGTLATIYNYPYYPQIVEKLGYKKDVDWVEYRIKVPETVPGRLERLASAVQHRFGLNVVVTKRPKDLLPYAREIFELINAAYDELYGVIPLTQNQMAYYTKQYFSFIRADFISMITDRSGRLAAVGITMPSLSRALQKSQGKLFPFGFYHLLRALKKNDLVDLLIVAVRKDFRDKGVNAILMNEMARSYQNSGIKFAESNPELEENLKVQSIWQHFEAVQHKRRRCYIKQLSAFA